MARPKKSRPAIDVPQTVPDRSLTAEDPLPTIAIRAAGTHQFVYRKMLDGPVGPPLPTTATWCAWSTAMACTSATRSGTAVRRSA